MPTPEEIVAQLHPPRLTVSFAGLHWQDFLAVFGIGMLLGVMLYFLLLLFLHPKIGIKTHIEQELKNLRTLAPQDRLFQQARILARLRDSGQETPAWRKALYQRNLAIDHHALDVEILQIAAGKKA